MGLEGFEEKSKMNGLRRVITLHKRSKSFPDKRKDEKEAQSSSMETSNRVKLDMGPVKDNVALTSLKEQQSPKKEVRNSLKEEIVQLEKRLQEQFQVRSALERALGYRTSTNISNLNDVEIPKPATELIKDIAVLEVEVTHLEQYLLSLYRKAFDGQPNLVSPPKRSERSKSPANAPRSRILEASKAGLVSIRESSAVQSSGISHREEKLLDSGVHRCHSTVSQRSTRASPPGEASGKALRYCHSQPLSMSEYAQSSSSNIISLAEHLGTRISDHIPETPNRLSEDMMKCMTAIYCKLSDPPLTHNTLSSPNSSLSSVSGFSPREAQGGDMWSPEFRNNSSFDVQLDNPFHVEGLKEFSGPYSTMVEVPLIYRDSQKLGDIDHLLQNFRSLISRLEEVDPRRLDHDEKLAFWINIHNALVMHAFLAYGIPQNNVKRVLLLLKAAYNIGGHTISADTIQSCILGCRMSRPGQWLRLLLSRSKFKAGDDRQGYAIHHPEPLLHFALCSGSHSDPAVRVYTPKRVLQELEGAKEEYIRASFGVRKDHRILLPKIVESFAKDSGFSPVDVLEMVRRTLPKNLRKSVDKSQPGKLRKTIEWIPHNFAFRYLISKELAK